MEIIKNNVIRLRTHYNNVIVEEKVSEMDDEKFRELMRTMRVMKSNDSGFSADRFVNYPELTSEQVLQIEKEFGQRKKITIENSFLYNYFENDYF